jgi:serine/threonine protein kinase
MTPDTRIGTVLAGCRISSEIGRGGMGVVYLAEHLHLGRKVALKLLPPEYAQNERFRERFVRESRLAATIDHPNVIPVYDAGEWEGLLYMSMLYVDGSDLRQLIEREGALPPRRAARIIAQVAGALDAAHGVGLVHRDVKPGNVLDAGVGTWKVADFGIAKWVHADETLTGTGELLGSPSYLAPERIEGEQAGPASDLYAVGVLLYEAMTGRKPFEGDDPFALAAAIREGRYEPPGAVRHDADPGIAAVIERAMRREPAGRFESAEAMAVALAGKTSRVADDTEPLPGASDRNHDTAADATETVRIQPMEQTARLPYQAPSSGAPRRRPRGLLIVGGAILAVVLITVLALAVFTGPDSPGAGGAGSTLPVPLEDALSRLEEAVRP